MIKETAKGYWIGYDWFPAYKKWIPKESKRRFAYPSKDAALTNFIKRTERRIEIINRQKMCCEVSLSLAEKLSFSFA